MAVARLFLAAGMLVIGIGASSAFSGGAAEIPSNLAMQAMAQQVLSTCRLPTNVHRSTPAFACSLLRGSLAVLSRRSRGFDNTMIRRQRDRRRITSNTSSMHARNLRKRGATSLTPRSTTLSPARWDLSTTYELPTRYAGSSSFRISGKCTGTIFMRTRVKRTFLFRAPLD